MALRRWFPMILGGAACVSVACAQGSDDTSPYDGSVGPSDAASGVHDAWSDVAQSEHDAASDAAGAADAPGAADGPGDATSSDAATIADAGNDVTDAPATSDAPITCTGGKIACGGVCVDPTSDPNNCGACGTVCSSGMCGGTVAAAMTASPPNWNFNGTAMWSSAGPSAQMTAAKAAGAAGTVVYAHPIVTDSFIASFQFRMGANGGGRYDGMGFMIESTGPTAVGPANGALGMANLGGYGVEFDVYNNGQCGDVSDDQVGVDLLQPCTGTMPTSLFASPDLTGKIDIADAQWHTVNVQLTAGAMSVSVDGTSIASNVALKGFVTGTSYYYGFSGGTGGGSGNGGIQTEAKNVAITFPTPRCL